MHLNIDWMRHDASHNVSHSYAGFALIIVKVFQFIICFAFCCIFLNNSPWFTYLLILVAFNIFYHYLRFFFPNLLFDSFIFPRLESHFPLFPYHGVKVTFDAASDLCARLLFGEPFLEITANQCWGRAKFELPFDGCQSPHRLPWHPCSCSKLTVSDSSVPWSGDWPHRVYLCTSRPYSHHSALLCSAGTTKL